MLATISMTILLAQSALGSGFGHHGGPVGCCDVCGVSSAKVARLIVRLQTCPRWRDRDDAAGDLRDFDWRCHPEAAEALATALLRDCEEEVREEAAESLAKMKPCLPSVHMALRYASNRDPDHATRRWARKGLSGLDHRCQGACQFCGPIPGGPAYLAEPALYPPGAPTIPLEPSSGYRLKSTPNPGPSVLPPLSFGPSPFDEGPPVLGPLGPTTGPWGGPNFAPMQSSPPPVPSGPYGPAY